MSTSRSRLVLAVLIPVTFLAHAGFALRERHVRTFDVFPVSHRHVSDWSLPAARLAAVLGAVLLLVQAIRFSTRGHRPVVVASWVLFLGSLINIRWGPVALGVPSWYDITKGRQTSGFATVVALDLLIVLGTILLNLKVSRRDGPVTTLSPARRGTR
jgi:hypothetical protein